MKTTYSRFIGVAIVVCLFAVGMATFLNYFKYKSTVEKVVRDRVLIIAANIEDSVESSLSLGMGFSELSMLQSLMDRERSADRLVRTIEIFDPAGKVLYSTDPARVGARVADIWLATVGRAKDQWAIEEEASLLAGITLRNSFNLAVGYLAVRYDRAYVDRSIKEVGRNLALIGVAAFILVTLLVSGALVLILRRFERDMKAIESRVSGGEAAGTVPAAFASAVDELNAAVGSAEADLSKARAALSAAKA